MTLLVTLGLCCYALLVVSLKLWAYPGWTWKGFLGDVKSAVGLTSLFSPVVIYLLIAYRKKTPGETIVEALQHRISLRFALLASCFFLVVIVVLAAAILIVGERAPSPELSDSVSQRNWTIAEEVLGELKTEPLRREVELTLETYVRVNEASEKEQFTNSITFQDYRNTAGTLFRAGYDMGIMNTLSFAEASKAIFLVEKAPAVLEEGEHQLTSILPRIRSKQQKSVALEKLGELLLVNRDYASAQRCFQDALPTETRPYQRALITSYIANTLAAQGKTDDAIQLYRQAEPYYPEGRQFIFHSNLGFLLMQAKKYPEAENEIVRALRSKPDDWISCLNLALVHDATGSYGESEVQYKLVRDKADPNSLAHKEGLILMGRSAELWNKPFDVFVGLYLEAAGRAHSADDIERLRRNPAELSNLYRAMATALKQTNTQGIEEYIDWFEQRSTSISIS